jgi:hypothetical protein
MTVDFELSGEPGRSTAGWEVERRAAFSGKGCVDPVNLRQTELAVDLSAVADLDDHDDEVGIVNDVKDTVVALAQPVEFVTGEFLAPRRPRVAREALNVGDDPTTVFLRQGLDVFDG